MPRLSARWYATIDEERIPDLRPPDDAKPYQRLVLGILNRDHTPITISDLRLNPAWPGGEVPKDASWPVPIGGEVKLAPGEMLLVEVEKKPLPPAIDPDARSVWQCRFPTRATMNVAYRQQIVGQQGMQMNDAFTLEIPDPMPSALAYGWTLCSALRSREGPATP
ncbi:hypothetical protein [Roseateles chitinivorans]|nr:hypothetical protein [Roseateles chitinivorans]